jgi:predicted kinase
VIVLVGLPASGKSTWAREQGLPVLSSDETRLLLSGDETNQAIHNRVFGTLRYLLKQRLAIGMPVTCIDATNLLPKHRKPWIKIAHQSGALAEAVFFDTPLDECIKRKAARARVVPEDVIRAMATSLKPPKVEEGFARVRTIAASPKARTKTGRA